MELVVPLAILAAFLGVYEALRLRSARREGRRPSVEWRPVAFFVALAVIVGILGFVTG